MAIAGKPDAMGLIYNPVALSRILARRERTKWDLSLLRS